MPLTKAQRSFQHCGIVTKKCMFHHLLDVVLLIKIPIHFNHWQFITISNNNVMSKNSKPFK